MFKNILLKYWNKNCVIINEVTYTYSDVFYTYKKFEHEFSEAIKESKIIAIDGIVNLNYIAIMLYLLDSKKIVVPLSIDMIKKERFLNISNVEKVVNLSSSNLEIISISKYQGSNELLNKLYETNHSGLILFSSGTTSDPKVILHDMDVFLKKYTNLQTKNDCFLSVLKLTHIGGLNTLLHSLFSGSSIVITENFTVKSICQTIENFKVTILPATPSFINLLLMTGEYNNYNLSSLKTISYGTEVMPESLLKKLNRVLPQLKIKQTYGLSEMGIFSTKSYSNESLLIKIDERNYTTKIENGILYIKSPQSMLGYLNYDNPFDEEGWFNTQDTVEEYEGGYLKILGRNTEIINIAGNKVYPSYIENILLNFDSIQDVVVIKGNHKLFGNYIIAKVKIDKSIDPIAFKKDFFEFCKKNLEKYQIPQKLIIQNDVLYSSRLKKVRY